MAPFIDPRLSRMIDEAGETGLVDAVIVVGDSAGSSTDDSGLVQRVIARAAGRAGEPPARVRCFPRANAAALSATTRFLREILKDPDLAVASAADTETAFMPSLISSAERSRR
jgi:hypothetical protein